MPLMYYVLFLCISIKTSKGNPDNEPRLQGSDYLVPGKFPYLVLLEVKSPNSDFYLNGVIVSLRWVLTVSEELSKVSTGRLESYNVSVYAGVTSLSDNSTTKYPADRIVTNAVGDSDNTIFPRLVLIGMSSELKPSTLVGSTVFNTGMISEAAFVAGWAYKMGTTELIPRAVIYYVYTISAKYCTGYQVVDDLHAMCCYPVEKVSVDLLEGALLVDTGYVTALNEFNTYYQFTTGASLAMLVRIGFYVPWVQEVAGHVKQFYLQTDNPNDDLSLLPWDISSYRRIVCMPFVLLCSCFITLFSNKVFLCI